MVAPLPVILISPAPVCVPVPVILLPTYSILPPSANMPLVKANTPEIVIAEFAVNVALELFKIKLLKATTLEGILNVLEVPPKDKIDDEVVLKFVAVPAIAGPFKVNVRVATDKVPAVKVSVPLMIGLPVQVKPPALFNSRFCKVTEPIFLADPFILILPEPVCFPDPNTEPLTVIVLPPSAIVPLVRVSVPLIGTLPDAVMVLFGPGAISRLPKVVTAEIVAPLPVILIFPLPLCVPVPVILPVRVIVFPASANVPLVKARVAIVGLRLVAKV